MRRADREVTDKKCLEDIIKDSKICRIAMNDEDGIYIVPVNFGYTFNNGELEIFFHGAKEGKKADILSKGNVYVGFEMEGEHELIEGDTACSYSFKYSSIIGKGHVSIVTDKEDKKYFYNQLMIHQTGKSFDFTDKMVETSFVFKLKVKSYSGKKHI